MQYQLIKKQEAAKVDFAIMLNELLEQKNISQSKLAQLSYKSKSLISRIMGGDSNLTIETMVSLLDAIEETLVLTTESRLKTEYKQIVNYTATSATLHLYTENYCLENKEWQTLSDVTLKPVSYSAEAVS